MPWGFFSLTLLGVLVLQTGVIGVLPVVRGAVDLPLALAVACALVAPVYDARIAAWIVGLAVGLASSHALGVHALAFGLAAWIVTDLRSVINIGAWWGRLFVALLGAVPAHLVVELHARFWEIDRGDSPSVAVARTIVIAGIAAAVAVSVTALPGMLSRRRGTSRWARTP